MSAVKKPALAVVANDEPCVDPDQIARFIDGAFRHARPGEGLIASRAFRNKRKDNDPNKHHTVYKDWVPINGETVSRITAGAQQASQKPAGDNGWTFAPPVCLVRKELAGRARLTVADADIVFGGVISVDLDERPDESLAKLAAVLGEPTMIVSSGGLWEGQAKRHVYWRLKQPARDRLALGYLRNAREYARTLVGGDKTGDPVNHPMRWPGSLHTKTTPRLTRIVGGDPEREVDLVEAGAALLDALAEAKIPLRGHVPGRTGKRTGFKTDEAATAEQLMAIAKSLPNDDLAWDPYRVTIMTWFDAAHGSVEGLEAVHVWAAKSSKYDPAEVDFSWSHVAHYPADDRSIGSLIRDCKLADPKFRFPAAKPFDVERWYEELSTGSVWLDPVEAPEMELATEVRIAREFVTAYAKRIRYAHDLGAWFYWNGVRLCAADDGLVEHWAAKFAASAVRASKADVKRVVEKANFVKGVLALARNDPRIVAKSAEWDQDAFLIGTPGGTLDLKTGRVRPAQPSDGITKLIAAGPAEAADCPLWCKFLDDATGGDTATIRFLQQFAGYCLTGSTKEHALLFLFGDGGNGKGAFLSVLEQLLEDYSAVAAMKTFVASKFDSHATSIAMLRGARLVTASETQQGRAWDEALIKSVTGGDKLTANFMRQDNITFAPTFKLLIIGNHKPVLNNVDDAARRRFNMVPFIRKPSKEDRDLVDKLMLEAPGILRWMIDGCLDWQRNGLVRSPAVLGETEAYFRDQDVFGQWFDECLEPCGPDTFLPSGDLYRAWQQFAKQSGEEVGSARAFGDRIKRRGATADRKPGVRGYRGIRWRAET